MSQLPDRPEGLPGADPPPQPRRRGPVATLTTLLGGQVPGAGMALVGTPWWAVAAIALVMALLAAVVLAAQILIPDESADKLVLWREVLQHRERRGRDRHVRRHED